MQTEYSKRNQAIGNLIGEAKRRLLDASKENQDIKEACDQFILEVTEKLGEVYGDACPQTLPNSPGARTAGGYRILEENEIHYICEILGEQSGGPVHTGYLILLLEHIVASHLKDDYPVEGVVITLSNKLISSDPFAIDAARKTLTKRSEKALREMIKDLAAEDAKGAIA